MFFHPCALEEDAKLIEKNDAEMRKAIYAYNKALSDLMKIREEEKGNDSKIEEAYKRMRNASHKKQILEDIAHNKFNEISRKYDEGGILYEYFRNYSCKDGGKSQKREA